MSIKKSHQKYHKKSLNFTETINTESDTLNFDSPEFSFDDAVQLKDRSLQEIMSMIKNESQMKFLTENISGYEVGADGVFPNARDLVLSKMDYIGFDYDYTLANYTAEIQPLIYNLTLDYLLKNNSYPEELRKLKYDPNFAIRGLYYDTKKGNILKLDLFYNIQTDAVYHGRKKLAFDDILEQYGATHIGPNYHHNLRPLSDNFSMPELCLIADVIEYFNTKLMSYDPTYVYADISKAVGYIHTSGLLHGEIMNNLPRYLEGKRPGIVQFLSNLKKAKKKIFLLTNSGFEFVDKGMSFLLNDVDPDVKDWKKFFDVIMVRADKPTWFSSGRPFRKISLENKQVAWERVSAFRPGGVYTEGSMEEFMRLTNVRGNRVLYAGDHLFADVKQPTKFKGWRTAVIISELEREIKIQHTEKYVSQLSLLLKLKKLKRLLDVLSDNRYSKIQHELRLTIHNLHLELKCVFNPYFGSVFRTKSGATLFAFELQRFGDVYTSHIENFNKYPLNFVHSSGRTYLPHEIQAVSNFDDNVLQTFLDGKNFGN